MTYSLLINIMGYGTIRKGKSATTNITIFYSYIVRFARHNKIKTCIASFERTMVDIRHIRAYDYFSQFITFTNDSTRNTRKTVR